LFFDLLCVFFYQLFIKLLPFSRLFSCGTSKDGKSYLVEWNESEGSIKRSFVGFREKSAGVVRFDTTQNHFLAAGDDGQIKFWDMENTNVLTSTDADGGLQVIFVFGFFFFVEHLCFFFVT
jgi:WD40 repeat protein